MDIVMIERTIRELESGETTFDACQKLASLYTIVNQFNKVEDDRVEQELNDILPMYQIYVKTKRRYQKHEVTDEAVIDAMRDVCREIKEFIQMLYSGTDMPKERYILENMIEELKDVV